MVWAGISAQFRTPLIVIDGNLTSARYINEILEPHVLPFLQSHPSVRILQQDNARPYSAQMTVNFLLNESVEVLPWSSYSPDFNPIEHLWDELGRRLRLRRRQPVNRQTLIRALQEEWERIPQGIVQKLVLSMRRRLIGGMKAFGGHTRY